MRALFVIILLAVLILPPIAFAEVQTLTLKSEVDPDDIQKQLAAQRVDHKVRNQVTEQAERMNTLEDSLRAKMEEMRSLDGDSVRCPPQQNGILLTPTDLASIREHASAGDAQAQNLLGEIYAVGESVPQDSDKAREWFEKASAQNYAKGQYNLGMQYTDDTDGWVSPQDYAKARQLWENAAAQGNASAQSALGWLYSHTRGGVRADYIKARDWYEKAAAQGDMYAQIQLGVLYEHGRGLPQDFAKAHAWYEKAAAQGDARAMMQLGMQDAYGLVGTSDFVKAREWFEKAAAQGDPMAQSFLGDLYAKGRIVPQDYLRACMWYSLSAVYQTGNDQYRSKSNRDVIARSMTPAQIAEADRLAQLCQAQQFKGC